MKIILLSALATSAVISSAQLMASAAAADSAAAPVAYRAGLDPTTYVALNPDLQDYIRANPDQIAATGGPMKWAISHYLNYGRNEGRNFQSKERMSPGAQQMFYSFAGQDGAERLGLGWSDSINPAYRWSDSTKTMTSRWSDPDEFGISKIFLSPPLGENKNQYWEMSIRGSANNFDGRGYPRVLLNINGYPVSLMTYKADTREQVVSFPGFFANEDPAFMTVSLEFHDLDYLTRGRSDQSMLGLALESITVKPLIYDPSQDKDTEFVPPSDFEFKVIEARYRRERCEEEATMNKRPEYITNRIDSVRWALNNELQRQKWTKRWQEQFAYRRPVWEAAVNKATAETAATIAAYDNLVLAYAGATPETQAKLAADKLVAQKAMLDARDREQKEREKWIV